MNVKIISKNPSRAFEEPLGMVKKKKREKRGPSIRKREKLNEKNQFKSGRGKL